MFGFNSRNALCVAQNAYCDLNNMKLHDSLTPAILNLINNVQDITVIFACLYCVCNHLDMLLSALCEGARGVEPQF